jgi:hypothetical protein
MRTLVSTLFGLFVLFAYAQYQPLSSEFDAGYQQALVWVKYTGSIPSNAVYGGKESNGTKLAVCRCDYNGAKHPGKVVGTACNIGWGGREAVVTNFEILTNPSGLAISYQVFDGRNLPANAVSAGKEAGNELYVGSAEHMGGMHPGKIFWVGNKFICNFGYGGKEVTATGQVKILTATPPQQQSTANRQAGNAGNLDGQTFLIECKQSGKYLDVNGGSLANGANIHQWTLHRGPNQQFTFRRWSDDLYWIQIQSSKSALDVAGASLQNGGNVHQWEFVRGDNQLFRVVPAGNGYVFIECAQSGKYLDVSGYSVNDGANIHQWEFHGGDNQQFRLVPVGGGGQVAQNPNTQGASATGACQDAVGHYMWFTNDPISLQSDGRISVYKGAPVGSWKCEGNRVRLTWNNGFVDLMELSLDKQTLTGKNQNNDDVSGRRLTKQEQDAIKIQLQAGDALDHLQKMLKKKD